LVAGLFVARYGNHIFVWLIAGMPECALSGDDDDNNNNKHQQQQQQQPRAHQQPPVDIAPTVIR